MSNWVGSVHGPVLLDQCAECGGDPQEVMYSAHAPFRRLCERCWSKEAADESFEVRQARKRQTRAAELAIDEAWELNTERSSESTGARHGKK